MATYLQALLSSSAGVEKKREDGVNEASREALNWYEIRFKKKKKAGKEDYEVYVQLKAFLWQFWIWKWSLGNYGNKKECK